MTTYRTESGAEYQCQDGRVTRTGSLYGDRFQDDISNQCFRFNRAPAIGDCLWLDVAGYGSIVTTAVQSITVSNERV